MKLKNALTFLAADLRKVALGTGGFVAAGSFFGGGDWNIIAGVVIFSILEGIAFYLQTVADSMP